MSTFTIEQRKWQPELKLCIDCLHCRKQKFVSEHQCHHPNSDGFIISPVDGSIWVNPHSEWKAYCSNARDGGLCGPEGKYFERKPIKRTFLQKLKLFF